MKSSFGLPSVSLQVTRRSVCTQERHACTDRDRESHHKVLFTFFSSGVTQSSSQSSVNQTLTPVAVVHSLHTFTHTHRISITYPPTPLSSALDLLALTFLWPRQLKP